MVVQEPYWVGVSKFICVGNVEQFYTYIFVKAYKILLGNGMMKKAILWLIVSCLFSINAVADIFGTGVNQFEIDFVTISGDTNPTSGSGIVSNDYRMGKFEITNEQWDKFVNSYGTVTGSPSIAYDEGSTWTGANIPVNRVSWYEAAQFVNWLNVSTGHEAAYKFTGIQGTSDYAFSSWDITDSGYNPNNPYRNSNSFYFLPTEDEWIKAAYWNGAAIQTYATKAGDTLHQGDGLSGTGWNYWDWDAGYATDPYGPWNVGSGSEELNGTYDMMGNVSEMLESPFSDEFLFDSMRDFKGGSYWDHDGILLSSFKGDTFPDYENLILGFRVASVPEPATLSLVVLGGLLLRRKRK